jgi:DNA-binding IclR family transcriptional regulator
VQVVVRALQVLQALAATGRGLTLQELHERLRIPVGSMHRMLATLAEHSYVTRSPSNRRYFLGPAARQLSEQNRDGHGSLVAPHPAVVSAAEDSGETVFLTELVGNRAVCIALVPGRHPLRLFVRIGQEMPLHAAASSRASLAYLGEHEARRLLAGHPLTAFTMDTPTTVDQVLEHLALVRARGYDVCDDELDRGVWAVSAPIFTSTGHVDTSVTLAAAAARLRDPLKRTQATQLVLTAARAMSEELGFTGEVAVADPPAPPGLPRAEHDLVHSPVSLRGRQP